MECDGAGDQILFHQIQTQKIHHFLDNEKSFVKGIVAAKHLPAGKTAGAGPIVFDVGDGDRFSSPGVVDQKFGVDAE